jgi:hypothetical protein
VPVGAPRIPSAPISASTAEIAPAKLATQRAASSRRSSAVGKSKIGTIRMAYVHAVANQIQTRLGPPSANLVRTTSAGSRSMSGQSNVADRMVAAVANERAPIRNSVPVMRRSRRPLLWVLRGVPPSPEIVAPTSVKHDGSAVAFDHVRDEIANEAAGWRIGSAGERLFEGDGSGSGDPSSELVREGHTAVVVHHGEDLGNQRG